MTTVRDAHMTRIYTTIHIRKPIAAVFDYVTTPANWPQWHPSSLGVNGATGHSLDVGEQVTEAYLVAGLCGARRQAGRRGRVVWTVREREAPCRWVIEGRMKEGRSGRIESLQSNLLRGPRS